MEPFWVLWDLRMRIGTLSWKLQLTLCMNFSCCFIRWRMQGRKTRVGFDLDFERWVGDWYVLIWVVKDNKNSTVVKAVRTRLYSATTAKGKTNLTIKLDSIPCGQNLFLLLNYCWALVFLMEERAFTASQTEAKEWTKRSKATWGKSNPKKTEQSREVNSLQPEHGVVLS